MNLPRPSTRFARRSAFTLMEMILVLAIIAILIAIGATTLGDFDQQAKVTSARAQISTISSAVRMYNVNQRNLPPNLDALVKPPRGAAPYIEASGIMDPWNNKYLYKSPGSGTRSFEVYSAGPDKREGTEDDITRD